MEFGGFIGGFGKIFFTKGGIKREKEGFGGVFGMGGRSYIFLKSFEGVEENSKFYGGMYFWGSGVGREIFGLRRRRDNIYYL